MAIQYDFEKGLVIGLRGKAVGSKKWTGYIEVYVGGARKLAHRLIWEAANGPIPAGLQINHKNGIKTDNRLCNLEVVTPSENILHAHRTGLANSPKGEAHPGAKLCDQSVIEIRSSLEKNGVLAAKYGVDPSIISEIKNFKRWKHVECRSA